MPSLPSVEEKMKATDEATRKIEGLDMIGKQTEKLMDMNVTYSMAKRKIDREDNCIFSSIFLRLISFDLTPLQPWHPEIILPLWWIRM